MRRQTSRHLRRAAYHTQQTLTGFGVELLWIARVQWYLLRSWLQRLQKRTSAPSAHDRHWQAHPAVATGDDLTFGQRAADHMRSGLGTWTFLFVLAGLMALWVMTAGFGHDAFPYILLNLCLSTLAGVQAAVLLIAAKRSDQVAAATALHTLENTEQLASLIEANTALTEQVATLTRELHARWTPSSVAPVAQADQPPSDASNS